MSDFVKPVNKPIGFSEKIADLRLRILNSWYEGEIAFAEQDDDEQEFRMSATQLAQSLETKLEIHVDPNGKLQARANRGFPLEIQPYSQRGKQWAVNHPAWMTAQRAFSEMVMERGC